jgi:phosphoglycerol transferase MdoB-like AlkP superfamily enzyme
MLLKWKVTKSVQLLLRILFLYIAIFTVFRIITMFLFKPTDISYLECLNSFGLGIQYDLRWIAFILIPPAIGTLFNKTSPFYSERTKKIWTIYFAFITLIVLFLFGADFGQFAYVRARLNADALNFFEDPKEMWEMVSSSYPIFWILLALAFAVFFFNRIFKQIQLKIEDKNLNVHKFYYMRVWNIIFILVLGWFIRGAFTINTLRFDRAFKLKNNFVANLALNPMQNFATTLSHRKPDVDNNAKSYYKLIGQYLGLDTVTPINKVSELYKRQRFANSKYAESNPNIVLVICESFSMYKSSMSGNKLNATPYFNELSKKGLFFDRCFTPHFSTARGVFATLTGIPDVQMSKFSSRNEDAVTQRTLINEFKNYDKYYFIGGNSEFNNFKGIVKNIDDVKIYEEGSYKSPKVNVWGISDKDLFKEANQVLGTPAQKPFFAIIQTADNHRPFDLYKNDAEFKAKSFAKEELQQFGFDSEEEYNTFRYSDFCFEKFIEQAKQLPYFNNTIFIFVGDHGVEGASDQLYPKAWNEQRLSDEHVPLLFYAPKLISPQLRHEVVSQIDILPSAAGLSGIDYNNYTLGRDIVHHENKTPGAFIIYHAPAWIGFVNDEYFYRYNMRSKNHEMVSTINNDPVPANATTDSIKKSLHLYTIGIYETAKWMLLNNNN